mmetsp:Transcript_32202/g.91366  ORF Transcript_32202/g.91366 Transcript_32202/m.91366 type:complete len:222 (+) Transcript_32202:1137-1802(+)
MAPSLGSSSIEDPPYSSGQWCTTESPKGEAKEPSWPWNCCCCSCCDAPPTSADVRAARARAWWWWWMWWWSGMGLQFSRSSNCWAMASLKVPGPASAAAGGCLALEEGSAKPACLLHLAAVALGGPWLAETLAEAAGRWELLRMSVVGLAEGSCLMFARLELLERVAGLEAALEEEEMGLQGSSWEAGVEEVAESFLGAAGSARWSASPSCLEPSSAIRRL